jgi:ribonuclease T2
MWPNFATPQSGHDWPQCCQTSYGAQLQPAVVQNILSYLQMYWPNEADPDGKQIDATLWAHEWGKHGTCSGLDQEPYFQAAMNLQTQLGTPDIIHQNIGGTVKMSDLFAAFGQTCSKGEACKVGFSCANGALDQILTCWDQKYNQVICPEETVGKWTCLSDTVNIPSF